MWGRPTSGYSLYSSASGYSLYSSASGYSIDGYTDFFDLFHLTLPLLFKRLVDEGLPTHPSHFKAYTC